jgi:hypothetical protein
MRLIDDTLYGVGRLKESTRDDEAPREGRGWKMSLPYGLKGQGHWNLSRVIKSGVTSWNWGHRGTQPLPA